MAADTPELPAQHSSITSITVLHNLHSNAKTHSGFPQVAVLCGGWNAVCDVTGSRWCGVHGRVVPGGVAHPSAAAAERAPLPRPVLVQRLSCSRWVRIRTDAADLRGSRGRAQLRHQDILALGAAPGAAGHAAWPCGESPWLCAPSAAAAAKQALLCLHTTLTQYFMFLYAPCAFQSPIPIQII